MTDFILGMEYISVWVQVPQLLTFFSKLLHLQPEGIMFIFTFAKHNLPEMLIGDHPAS